MGDTACELAAVQSCLSVCKVMHLLRAVGFYISDSALLAHDDNLEWCLAETFGAKLPVTSSIQASCSIQTGGLGLRKAKDIALVAFVASRADCRDAVLSFVAEILPSDIRSLLFAAYDKDSIAAKLKLEAGRICY